MMFVVAGGWVVMSCIRTYLMLFAHGFPSIYHFVPTRSDLTIFFTLTLIILVLQDIDEILSILVGVHPPVSVQELFNYTEEDRQMMMDSFGSVGDSMPLDVAI